MTLEEFKLTTGLYPEDWTHERVVDGLTQAYWPAKLAGESGWWWCIATAADQVIGGGWCLGSVRDRNQDIARAMLRFQSRAA